MKTEKYKDVVVIRYPHSWGGQIGDRKFWEATLNGEVWDWNPRDALKRQAEAAGLPYVVLRCHRNGETSEIEKSIFAKGDPI